MFCWGLWRHRSLWSRLTRSHLEGVYRAQELRRSAFRVLSYLQDAETGQRGYLLTGDQSYLEPYEHSLREMGAEFDKLDRLGIADDQIADADVRRLSELERKKLAELKETVDLAQAGRRDDALEIVKANRGKEVMDEARATLARIIETADIQISARFLALQDTASTFRWVNIAGAALIVVFALGSLRVVNRYFREVVAARSELATLNLSLEQRVEERTAELSRANDEIQRFAYVVTHDLRAPLVNVMGFTAELERSLVAIKEKLFKIGANDPGFEELSIAIDVDMPEAIGFIRSSTTKMDGLIASILKLSREGRRNLIAERVDMRALLENAKAALGHQIDEANAEVTISPSLPWVISDRQALEQIFTNLLDNAVKYLQPDRPGQVIVRGKEEGRAVVFEVEDNGRGVAPHDRERIFEMFRRSGSHDRPGEGIGLAHVQSTLRRLGGEITLESELGRGAIFRIRLPQKRSFS